MSVNDYGSTSHALANIQVLATFKTSQNMLLKLNTKKKYLFIYFVSYFIINLNKVLRVLILDMAY